MGVIAAGDLGYDTAKGFVGLILVCREYSSNPSPVRNDGDGGVVATRFDRKHGLEMFHTYFFSDLSFAAAVLASLVFGNFDTTSS